MSEFELRAGDGRDRPLLEAMLYEAFGWDPEEPRPDFEAMRGDVEFAKWIEQFGERDGDVACVAESRAGRDARLGAGASASGPGATPRPLGVAWYRSWTADRHSYGFVAEDVPELAIGVVAGERGRGVGRALLGALLERARASGVPAISLSVDPRNPALRLYRNLGFERVGESGTSWTLLLALEADGARRR